MGNSLPSLVHETSKTTPSDGSRTKHQFLNLKLCQLTKSKKPKQGCEMSTRGALESTAIPAEQGNYDGHRKRAMRVKVVLTKKEAAQLLAMYVSGDQEKVIAKVAHELERVDAHRQMSAAAWRPSLASIPED